MKILAIDLGLKRIGLAYSADENFVTPLKAVERKNRNQASKEVKDVVKEWGIESIVIGIPMDGGDTEAEMLRRVAHFMKLVNFSGEVHHQDESFSSIEAEDSMKGMIKYKRDGRVDSLAAKIILERWLKEKNSKSSS